jgi:hypothetical protein
MLTYKMYIHAEVVIYRLYNTTAMSIYSPPEVLQFRFFG